MGWSGLWCQSRRILKYRKLVGSQGVQHLCAGKGWGWLWMLVKHRVGLEVLYRAWDRNSPASLLDAGTEWGCQKGWVWGPRSGSSTGIPVPATGPAPGTRGPRAAGLQEPEGHLLGTFPQPPELLGWCRPTSCPCKVCPGGRWFPSVLPWGHNLPGSLPRPPNPLSTPLLPQPQQGAALCSRRATRCHLVPLLLLCAAPRGSAMHVPSTQCPNCKGPPKQCLLLEL